jgi:hypothetical protein
MLSYINSQNINLDDEEIDMPSVVDISHTHKLDSINQQCKIIQLTESRRIQLIIFFMILLAIALCFLY